MSTLLACQNPEDAPTELAIIIPIVIPRNTSKQELAGENHGPAPRGLELRLERLLAGVRQAPDMGAMAADHAALLATV